MDTNFYGVVNVTRAALPIMRKQKSSYIFQISSVGGRLARPGSTGYHAAKWAVGGFTGVPGAGSRPFWRQGLRPRLNPVECGRIGVFVRTRKTPVLLPEYEPSVGAVIRALASYWGNEVSDPVKLWRS